jgi:ankyrin repeat protein
VGKQHELLQFYSAKNPQGFSVSNLIPRDAQREAVATLRASLTSAGKEDKCRLLLMLSECYAHGYGVRTDFAEALSYLQQAAMAGSIAAESMLLRISDAIQEGGDSGPRLIANTPVGALQIRQEFRDLEKRLASLENTQNFSARLRAWTRMGREAEEKVGFSFTDGEGHVFTVKPGSAVNLAHILETNAIKHIETAIVTTETEFASGRTLLLQGIASCGWTDLVRSLTKGTDLLLDTVPFLNDYGELSNPGNLLMAAASTGQAQTIKFLLASGVSASRWEGPLSLPSWVNPLHFLFMLEDEEIEEVARLLVEHGADPNMVGSYYLSLNPLTQDFPLELSGPPLDMAISVGDIRAVRVLLKHGADPLQKSGPTPDKQEHTCLELAVALHVHEIVDVLLGHLLDGTSGPPQPLKLNGLLEHVCGLTIGGKGMFRRWLLHGSEYRQACHRTIEAVLKYGISIDTKDDEGLTPLQVTAYASPCQHYVLEALLEHGADPNARNTIGGVPLMQCCRPVWEPEDNARATRTLIKFGADVNVAADDGQFIVHYHASANSTASLRVIIEAGASLDCADSVGVTPLFSAAGAGGVEALKLLLRQGANIDSVLAKEHPQKVTTPLGLAALFGKTKAVRALLDDGASIVQKGTQGTVLNIATRFKQMEIVRVMLQDYSSIFCKPWVLNSMDSDNHTPLEAAALGGPSFIDLVLNAGADIDFRNPGELESGTALATTISYGRLDSTIYMLEKGASVFCRGAPHEQMWTFLNEFVYYCGEDYDLRPKFAGFLLSSKKWIDKHQLLSVRNWAGQTILQSAVHHGQLAAVKALVEFGASLEDELHTVRLPYWSKTNHFWDVYKVEGLDIVSFARLLRNSTPKQKAVWAKFIPFEITTEDMDAIIQYLIEVRGHASPQTPTHHRSKSIFSRHFSRRRYGVRFRWSGSAKSST